MPRVHYLARPPSLSPRHARRQPQPRSLAARARHPVPSYNEAVKHVNLYGRGGVRAYAVDDKLLPTSTTNVRTFRVVVVLPRGVRDARFWRDLATGVQLYHPASGAVLAAQQVRRVWVRPGRRTALFNMVRVQQLPHPSNLAPYLAWIQGSSEEAPISEDGASGEIGTPSGTPSKTPPVETERVVGGSSDASAAGPSAV